MFVGTKHPTEYLLKFEHSGRAERHVTIQPVFLFQPMYVSPRSPCKFFIYISNNVYIYSIVGPDRTPCSSHTRMFWVSAVRVLLVSVRLPEKYDLK